MSRFIGFGFIFCIGFFGSFSNAFALDGENCSKVLARAREMTTQKIVYDGSYFKIPFPNGDVPSDIGVCTDLVVRSLRTIGMDLQQLVFDHVSANKKLYKGLYGSKLPDPNIDHRRVLNLRVFFAGTETELPLSKVATDYKPCDLVTWNLPKGMKHIGIVSDRVSAGGVPLILHHIFKYPTEDDVLFHEDLTITGHYSVD